MALVQEVNRSTTDSAFLFLLTITPPNGGTPIRVVNNNEDVVSRGNTYTAYPFALTLPNDDGETAPSVQLSIDNVDQLLVESIRESLQPPTFVLELVLSNNPDQVEKQISHLRLSNVEYDAMGITGTLSPINILSRKWPAETYDPVSYPGLFY